MGSSQWAHLGIFLKKSIDFILVNNRAILPRSSTTATWRSGGSPVAGQARVFWRSLAVITEKTASSNGRQQRVACCTL